MYQASLLFTCVNNIAQENMASDYNNIGMTPFKFEMPEE